MEKVMNKEAIPEDILRIGRNLYPIIREEIMHLRKDPKWQKDFAEWKAAREKEKKGKR